MSVMSLNLVCTLNKAIYKATYARFLPFGTQKLLQKPKKSHPKSVAQLDYISVLPRSIQ